MSIPLILNQSIKPKSLIIVDSSDDHEEACKAVEGAVSGFKGRLEIVKSARGSSHQRNVGLKYVTEEIVFFPDDDSMFFPGTSEIILGIYNADRSKSVGGVCTAEALHMPSAVTSELTYQSGKTDNLKKKLIKTKRAIERTLAPDPFMIIGQGFIQSRPAPDWLEQQNAVLVEFMTGFRMTFRTESIVDMGFNESFVNYGLFEDTDASFGVLRHQHLIGARNAKIFHHKFPGPRASGRFLGAAQILNRAYIVAKHTQPNSQARKGLGKYNAYTVMRYSAGGMDRFGRDRLAGAYEAARYAHELLDANPHELDACYMRLWRRCTVMSGDKVVTA